MLIVLFYVYYDCHTTIEICSLEIQVYFRQVCFVVEIFNFFLWGASFNTQL
jgi:hypothetical protein